MGDDIWFQDGFKLYNKNIKRNFAYQNVLYKYINSIIILIFFLFVLVY